MVGCIIWEMLEKEMERVMIREEKCDWWMWFKVRDKVKIDKWLVKRLGGDWVMVGGINIKGVIMIEMRNKVVKMRVMDGGGWGRVRNSMKEKDIKGLEELVDCRNIEWE